MRRHGTLQALKRSIRFETVALPVAALAFLGAMATGCTYTQVASTPPAYVQPEPEPYYEAPYYDGPFDDLSPYGTWIETTPFGWVWQPYVGAAWQPYDYGHWSWTRWGWTWVSYEPYGWATYHYGFWQYEPVYGWIWVPGNQWFPARVSWMYYGDYVLWAPIPPPGYYIPDPWDVHTEFIWVGVHVNHFTQREIGRYKIRDPRHVLGKVSHVKIRRQAPTIEHIEAHTKEKVRIIDVGTQKFTKGGREYERMVLPPAERETVVRYEQRVNEQVIKPQARPEGARPTTTKRGAKPEAKEAKKKSGESAKGEAGKSDTEAKEKKTEKEGAKDAPAKQPKSKEKG
jgi:hypothetical protein